MSSLLPELYERSSFRSAQHECEVRMPARPIPEDTSFTIDIQGRYACNSLDEALDSAVPGRKFSDARPFDHIVIDGGSFGGVLATRLFNLDIAHRHRILVPEAGPVTLPEHVQSLPPDFAPPGKPARQGEGSSKPKEAANGE
jgi:hypothetical protein